jgi:hypothetical protein
MLKTIAIVILGIGYTLYAIIDVLDGKALDSRGLNVQIEPMERITEVTRKKSNLPVDVSYEGNVTFITEAGQSVTVKRHLSASVVEKITQGRPVLIRYLPDNPTKARLEGEKGAGTSDIVIGFVVSVAGFLWFRKKLDEKPHLG